MEKIKVGILGATRMVGTAVYPTPGGPPLV